MQVELRINMPKKVVTCPTKGCGREIVTSKSTDIQCRDCGKRFDIE